MVGASGDIGAAIARGFTADGAGLRAPGVRPAELLQPGDVADAVRWVVGTPAHVCPVEVELQPQRSPSLPVDWRTTG